MKIFVRSLFFQTEVSKDFESQFENYYHQTKDFVRKVIYWNTRFDMIDDLVQETYLRAWKYKSSFKQDSSFKTWIYRIAINIARDHAKVISFEELPEMSSKDNLELHNQIEICLLQLNLEERELFILFYKLDYTFKEISLLVKKPESTIKSQIYKAKDKFSKVFMKIEEEYNG